MSKRLAEQLDLNEVNRAVMCRTLATMGREDPEQVLDRISEITSIKRRRLSLAKPRNYTFVCDGDEALIGWRADAGVVWNGGRVRPGDLVWTNPTSLGKDLKLLNYLLTFLPPREYLKCRCLSPKLKVLIESNAMWKGAVARLKWCLPIPPKCRCGTNLRPGGSLSGTRLSISNQPTEPLW